MRAHIKLRLLMALDLISQPQQLFWKAVIAGDTIAQNDFMTMSQRQPKLLAQSVALSTLTQLTPHRGLSRTFLTHLLTQSRQNRNPQLLNEVIRLCPPVTALLSDFCETLCNDPKLIKPCAHILKQHFIDVQNSKTPFIIHTILVDVTLNTHKSWPFWALKENIITTEEGAPFVFEHVQQMLNKSFAKSTDFKLNSAHQKIKLTAFLNSKSSEDFLKSDFSKELKKLIQR